MDRKVEIMGIVNLTPDSFFPGSRILSPDGTLDQAALVARVAGMIRDGADIIDVGIANKDSAYVLKIGGLMVLVSVISLFFGAGAGRFAALASTGLVRNLRKALFDKIQDFSFANTDHFSTPSLIT